VLPVDRPQPAPRVGAALAWDPVRRHIILFGGESTTLEQDTWEWEGTTWTQLAIQPPPPRARGILLAAADGLVLYGGAARYEATTGDELGDLWLLRYDGAGASAACRDGSDDDGDGLAGCADPDCWLACHATCLPGDACTTPPTCGDGVCAPLEIAGICTADCAVAGICGDSTCTMGAPGECAGDCP
jgi:hypothetical protein